MKPSQPTKRRPPRQPAVIPFERRNFPQEIIRQLEQITAIAGVRSLQVFEDFVYLAEVTLRALPDQVRAVGATSRFAPDPPEVAEIFSRVRSHYDSGWLTPDRVERVWQHFGQAFALLLEATAPGLWGEPNSLGIAGISGPDILGHIFQTWASPPGGKNGLAQILTPFPIASCMARILNVGIERMVYDRVKEALCHPDNIVGAAVLLASLAIPENEPGAHFEWFLNRCLPAAAPYLQPILVQEPAVGTGVMIMAHAAASPEWAVRYNIISYRAQDLDPVMVTAARAALMLYGINGYALQLEAAAAEALQSHRRQAEKQAAITAPGQAIHTVYGNGHSRPPAGGNTHLNFEQLFRAAATRSAAVEVMSR